MSFPLPRVIKEGYNYVEANPTNRKDYSAYSDRVGATGNLVHEYIGLDFIRQSPNFGKGQGRQYDSLFRKYTIGKLLDELARKTVGVKGNNKRPNLVDFDQHVLYEIKPENQLFEGRKQLDNYIKLVNLQLEPQDPQWSGGTGANYIPPRAILVPPAKVIQVDAPVNGLILYREKRNYNNAAIAYFITYAITRLLLDVKSAQSRRTAIFGY